MKTILWGKVDQRHLDDADLIAGITPTSYITNGNAGRLPPASNVPVEVRPVCPMQPEESRLIANYYGLVLYADALICVGHCPDLVAIAKRYALTIYEVPE
jgi:hypothetical protein